VKPTRPRKRTRREDEPEGVRAKRSMLRAMSEATSGRLLVIVCAVVVHAYGGRRQFLPDVVQD
jgi:hypothetical protein